jgi:hypothetical protein
MVLLLTGTILVGCLPARRGAQTQPAPQSTSQPAPLGSCVQSLPDSQRSPEGEELGFVRFDVTRQQWETIGHRLIEVLCRQGLWQQGVRFGTNFNQERTRFWVLIDPGRSGLTAREVLNRLLGRA